MADIITTLAALLTVAFGAFGFLAPRYTAGALDLATSGSTMGLSELRASVGGLFVVAGLAVLWLDAAPAYAMLGFAYAGAALGRAVSAVLDAPPPGKVALFGGIEAIMAAWFLWVGLATPGPAS
jgi:hypothetical protein